ncbi:hypothetical protein [Pseudomonas sp. NCCP-436]|uniref:hypothetical protein n=1 Tax=Pseudomonas sp. NCCP-436 TaxID=2842481 RepID=UPI001C805DE9|nr:hypothetical protein [Pseudomonas sp. NCCP-436]GIZ10808.1 hypothetical protein NCCP436_02240 [Pseudomonas sp. NCCP-436]
MKRWVKVALGGLAGVVVLTGLWLWDEPLQPQAQQWLSHDGSGESQAFLQLLGMAAPAGVDVRDYARQLLQRHRQFGLNDAMPEGSQSLALPELCRLGEGRCLARLQTRPEQIGRWLEEHAELRRRYLELLPLSDYRSLTSPGPDEPLPAFMVLERANRLLALEALQLASQGQAQQAMNLLTDKLAHLRRWLAQSDRLVMKMVLVSLISHDLESLAALYQAGLIGRPPTLAPLSAEELSMLVPLRHEFAAVAEGLRALPVGLADEVGWQMFWLFKPNMSVNDLLPRYQAALQWPAVTDELPTGPDFWRRLRNPIGSILVSVASPDLSRYVARVHDLDRKIELFNQLGRSRPQSARWDEVRRAYCADGPLEDPRGLRCLPWPVPAQ